jgi:hypothetical protein
MVLYRSLGLEFSHPVASTPLDNTSTGSSLEVSVPRGRQFFIWCHWQITCFFTTSLSHWEELCSLLFIVCTLYQVGWGPRWCVTSVLAIGATSRTNPWALQDSLVPLCSLLCFCHLRSFISFFFSLTINVTCFLVLFSGVGLCV